MSAPAPFRILLRMEVKPGMAEEFVGVWQDNAAIVGAHPANRGHTLARSTEEQDVYYIQTAWTSEAEFREFESSEAHLEHRGRLHPYRSAGSIAFLELVAEIPPTGAVNGGSPR